MKVNSQLERAQLENVTSEPAAATAGRVVWDTAAGKMFLDDATNWRAILRNDGAAILGNNGTAASNIRLHRGAAGVLQFVSGADVTAEGTLSTALNQISGRMENYATGSLPAFGNAGRAAWDTTTATLKLDSGSAWKEQADLTTAQTFTNKSLTDPVQTASEIFTQIATPATPAASTTKLYSKSDGKFYYMGPDGFEKAIGSGSGGGINYIGNPDSESATTGWATYADAAGVSPVDGTGGSPSSTFTRTTSSPLANTASFLWTKSAANRQGEGFSYDFTIDSAYKGQQLAINYLLGVDSGTFVTADMTVWVYDVTNAVLIQPSAYQVVNTTLAGPVQPLVFQASSNSTSYRLIFHTATTSALAYSLKFDNFSVGPQIASVGFAGSDTVSWTPVLTNGPTTNRTLSGVWGRSGEYLEGRFRISYTGAPSFSGTGISFTLPNGLVIDTAKLTGTNIYAGLTGQGSHVDVGVQTNQISLAYESTTALRVTTYLNGGSGTVTQAQDISATAPFTIGNGDYTEVSFRVPIVGWSTGVLSSDSAASRVVAMRATGSPPTGTIGAAYNTVIFGTIATDTHGSYNSTTGVWTCVVPGYYDIKSSFAISGTASTNAAIRIDKNSGTELVTVPSGIATSGIQGFNVATDGVSLIAGDTIRIQSYTDATGPAYSAAYGNSSFSVVQRQGPAQIQSATRVSASYGLTAALVVASNAVVIYDTKVQDTTGSYSTSTGLFTAPGPGTYEFKVNMLPGTTTGVYLRINGVNVGYLMTAGTTLLASGSLDYPMNAGDTAGIYIDTGGTFVASTAPAFYNRLSISRQSGVN